MSMNVSPVTFFPVPPVRPVTREPDSDIAREMKQQASAPPARQLTGSATGRIIDFKV